MGLQRSAADYVSFWCLLLEQGSQACTHQRGVACHKLFNLASARSVLICVLQARVLAARDHSGVVPLLEGRTAAGSLIIACGTFLPEGTTHMTEIKAGGQYAWSLSSTVGPAHGMRPSELLLHALRCFAMKACSESIHHHTSRLRYLLLWQNHGVAHERCAHPAATGEMKYGWHALPRPFKCGHRIIAGRASCDYGIRRRSIDAYNVSLL